jgi:hypothetical protein
MAHLKTPQNVTLLWRLVASAKLFPFTVAPELNSVASLPLN